MKPDNRRGGSLETAPRFGGFSALRSVSDSGQKQTRINKNSSSDALIIGSTPVLVHNGANAPPNSEEVT